MINTIKPILQELNKGKNVKGSLIMTKDGIIITSDFGKENKEDFYAAISSSICRTMHNSLKEINTNFSRYVITTDKGKLIFIDLEKVILFILTGTEINTAQLNIAIFQATSMIKKTVNV